MYQRTYLTIGSQIYLRTSVTYRLIPIVKQDQITGLFESYYKNQDSMLVEGIILLDRLSDWRIDGTQDDLVKERETAWIILIMSESNNLR